MKSSNGLKHKWINMKETKSLACGPSVNSGRMRVAALRSGTTEKVKQIALMFLYQLVGEISTMFCRKNDFLPMLGFGVTWSTTRIRTRHNKFLTSDGP